MEQQITSRLPAKLRPLAGLAYNLRWAWNDPARDLFIEMDPQAWEATGHNPVAVLSRLPEERMRSLAEDQSFLDRVGELSAELSAHLNGKSWFQTRPGTPLRLVAYFSPEFGITEAIPQYSGGLGILAGDHLKAASSAGIPLVGIGLYYSRGYFRQALDASGWQQEIYPPSRPEDLPLRPAGSEIEVDMAGDPVRVRIWEAGVGRTRLLLLDSDVEGNDDAGRSITDALYSGDPEHRIRQEILLGIGGMAALKALGIEPQIVHLNEGHAGFSGLARIAASMKEQRAGFDDALASCRASSVFTTHTPVPAGIDIFGRPLMERYLKNWADRSGIGFDRLYSLGLGPGEPGDAPFNMAFMGLRLAGRANAVSVLHAEVSREMFARLSGSSPAPAPITSVTNGVHGPTWVSRPMRALFNRHLSAGWAHGTTPVWHRIDAIPDGELWAARNEARIRLVSFVRDRAARAERARHGASPQWCSSLLDPDALTIGFSRRFAAYKRATMVLSDPDRLLKLLKAPGRPVQIVFAGKAHPADEAGKRLIQEVFQLARREDLRDRIALLEDYDIGVAKMLLAGSDLWLNTPLRRLEACGTSGQKAALNGAVNCSILDGWWDEMFDGENGWAIPSAEHLEDAAARDAAEAGSLYEILEQEVVPAFWDRGTSGIPAAWMRRMKASLRSLGPKVLASRMIRDYMEEIYEPAALGGPPPAAYQPDEQR